MTLCDDWYTAETCVYVLQFPCLYCLFNPIGLGWHSQCKRGVIEVTLNNMYNGGLCSASKLGQVHAQ